MCGIVGFNWDDITLLKNSANLLSHRGPDQEGYFTDGKVSLGHKRLSIIDLSEKGTQPIFNEDKDICVVYNGEIYNFKDIRSDLEKKGHTFSTDTDTEVIVHAYEEYKERCVSLFNGCFAFAIYDSKDGKLFLARDRLGIKPLYYHIDPVTGKLIFASEIKSILCDESIKKEVDNSSFKLFLSLSYNPSENTLFNGIKKLLPGRVMSFDLKSKKSNIEKYWDINVKIINSSEQFFSQRLDELFYDSIKKRLISDRPVGVYLSGGVDSGSVVAMINRLNKENGTNSEIKTFSVGFDMEDDELSRAEELASHFSTKHNSFIMKSDVVHTLPEVIWHSDEPIADPALIPIKLLSEKANKTATVVLTGDGADELFAGYEQYKFLTFFSKFKIIPRLVRNGMMIPLKIAPYSLLNKFFKYSDAIGEEGKKRVCNIFRDINDKPRAYVEFVSMFNGDEMYEVMSDDCLKKIENTPSVPDYFSKYFDSVNTISSVNGGDNKGSKLNFLNQMLVLETKNLLSEDFLMKNDKMTMAHSIEGRVPFLDHRVAELAFSMPTSLKMKGFNEKYILRKSMKKYLPELTAKRKKQRFYVPMDDWLNKDIKWFFDNMKKESSGYFNLEKIDKMFEGYNKSRLFYGRQLWNILSFEIWHKIYIEGIDKNKIF